MDTRNTNYINSNRRENFWYHMIRGINYYTYKYWWLVLFAFFIINLLYILTAKHDIQHVINPNLSLDSLNKALNKCCGY